MHNKKKYDRANDYNVVATNVVLKKTFHIFIKSETGF